VPLATYDIPEQLYRARGDEVNPLRPYYTGDVFQHVRIAEVQEDGFGIIMSQACTMRGPDGSLKETLWVAPVRPNDPIPATAWPKHHIRQMPLPELIGGDFYVVDLPNMGRARTEGLRNDTRIACLEEFGVNMLHQRMINNMSRVEVPLHQITEFTTANFLEADLLEEFSDTVCAAGVPHAEAVAAFEELMSQPASTGARRLRTGLRNPSLRSSVRKTVRNSANRWATEQKGPIA
jgi:hypothetical protein